MRDILIHAQKYMQIEEVTRSAITRPSKQGSEGEKPKQQFLPRKNLNHTAVALHKPPRHARESNKDGVVEPDLILFSIPVDHMSNASKHQPGSGARLDRSRKPEGTWIHGLLRLP